MFVVDDMQFCLHKLHKWLLARWPCKPTLRGARSEGYGGHNAYAHIFSIRNHEIGLVLYVWVLRTEDSSAFRLWNRQLSPLVWCDATNMTKWPRHNPFAMYNIAKRSHWHGPEGHSMRQAFGWNGHRDLDSLDEIALCFWCFGLCWNTLMGCQCHKPGNWVAERVGWDPETCSNMSIHEHPTFVPRFLETFDTQRLDVPFECKFHLSFHIATVLRGPRFMSFHVVSPHVTSSPFVSLSSTSVGSSVDMQREVWFTGGRWHALSATWWNITENCCATSKIFVTYTGKMDKKQRSRQNILRNFSGMIFLKTDNIVKTCRKYHRKPTAHSFFTLSNWCFHD